MKGPIKMQDKYFKFSQTSFKDVYSLTLRKFLYPWLFPELEETMNNAPGVKLSVEFVPTDPKYSPSLSPECSTHEHVKHLLKSPSNKNISMLCMQELFFGGWVVNVAYHPWQISCQAVAQ